MSEGKKDCKKVQGFFVDLKNVQKNNDKKFDFCIKTLNFLTKT